jgi:glycerol dehydrogenase-like iron-containing ADH family enzyme
MSSPVPIAPATYLCRHGAVKELAPLTAAQGRRPLLLHGSVGYARHERAIDAALADFDVVTALHRGPCTVAAIDAVSDAVRAAEADVLIAVGGGRVQDVGKAAAYAAGVPVLTLPTSAATCAAVRAHTVLYTAQGTPAGARPLPVPPAVCLIDLDVVASAPARLLAAGLLDALAKWDEIDLLHRRAPLTSIGGRSAHALARSIAEACDDFGLGAIAEIRSGRPAAATAAAIETAILLPGLVSGLAGGNNQMAVAHAVHDALTHVPEHDALHGELVGFGLVVQALLDDDPDRARARRDAIAAMGGRRTLADMGCSAALADDGTAIGERLAAAPAVVRAFAATPQRVAAAVRAADELLA